MKVLLRKLFRCFFVVFVTASSITASADPRNLAGTPESQDDRGKAFIEAWIAFRRDMDGLFAAKVRPEESADWVNAVPEFLLRDILRSAVDHEVILRASMRLARFKSDLNRGTISSLKSRYKGQMLGNMLGAALIAAGDVSFRKATITELSSPVFEKRAIAAVILAASDDRSAFEHLSKALKKDGEERDHAAWALGRFGGLNEEQLLRTRATLLPTNPAINAAVGELAFKRLFPDLYQSFLQQYRFYSDGMSSGGLYETWFILIEKAVSDGASNPDALRACVIKMREKPAFGTDPDLWSRRLASFVDFLDEFKKRQNGPKQAQWPRDFAEALAAIRAPSKTESEGERVAARRIAASISILSMLGPQIGYANFAEPTPFLLALSPGGERATDGNIGTSWHFRKTTPFILEHKSNRRLESIQILLWCPLGSKAPAAVPFTVSGVDAHGASWKVTTTLKAPLPRFQHIDINRDSAEQIQIEISQEIDRGAVCISEIRCQYGAGATLSR